MAVGVPQERKGFMGPLALLTLGAILYGLGAVVGPMAGIVDGLYLFEAGAALKGAGGLAMILAVLWGGWRLMKH